MVCGLRPFGGRSAPRCLGATGGELLMETEIIAALIIAAGVVIWWGSEG